MAPNDTKEPAMQITLDTRLADIGHHYGESGDLRDDIGDNLDAITDDLIDTSVVGQDWGMALDRVYRSVGVEQATVRDLRDELLEASEA